MFFHEVLRGMHSFRTIASQDIESAVA